MLQNEILVSVHYVEQKKKCGKSAREGESMSYNILEAKKGGDTVGSKNDIIHDNRRRPFAMVTKAVLDDETHIEKGVDKLIYAILCSYADNVTADAYPSIASIARRACCSDRTVRRSLQRLQALGLIRVEPRFNGIGKQTSNRYVLLETPDRFK